MTAEKAPTAKVQTRHGKGRVKPRASQLERGETTPPLRLAAVAHCDSEHGEREGDPAPRFAKSLIAGWLDRLHINTPAKETKHDKLEGLNASLEVLCSEGKVNRFMSADDSKNIYGNQYHVREPETRKLKMGFKEFADCVRLWQEDTLFVSEPLVAWDAAAVEAASRPAQDCLRLAEMVKPALAKEIKQCINWEWLDSLRPFGKLGRLSHMNLQVMGMNSLVPLKYDLQDRLLCQVRGRTRCLLVSPAHALHGLYPFPVHHAYDTFSMIDTEAIDTTLWPGADKVEGMQCILQPGDTLFIPEYWTVALHSLEPENVCLDFRLGFRWRSADAAEIQVARCVEQYVADLEGVEEVKHWLGVIARDEELECTDPGTLRGFYRIDLVQLVRDEVEENLGKKAYAEFLTAMCEGRLNPTTWLNKNFREPLYLLDEPVWLEDNRTEEEKKYPQFFRKDLEAKGWTVQKSESTLAIPGYNAPAQ
eukprot:jgi/Tetstr1/422293/TSEL_013137.t1